MNEVFPPPPLHVQDLDAGVHAAGGAQLTVRAESSTAAVALVAGHVSRLVRGCDWSAWVT